MLFFCGSFVVWNGAGVRGGGAGNFEKLAVCPCSVMAQPFKVMTKFIFFLFFITCHLSLAPILLA